MGSALADLGEMGSLGQEQAQEKIELEDMKGELQDVKKTMSQAANAMSAVGAQLQQPQVKEFHLIAREAQWEVSAGVKVPVLAYNGQIPGPVMRVRQGDAIRIILHNQLKVPTSLYFQGLILPQSVDGLPRKQAGLLAPGDTYAYQFVADRPGTVWYHPQVIHQDQVYSGLSGVLIVEPQSASSYTTDVAMVVQQWDVAGALKTGKKTARAGNRGNAASASNSANMANSGPDGDGQATDIAAARSCAMTYFTMNGKSAPGIPPIEVRKGDRVRLRTVNASQQMCPLYLTGHRFEIVAVNGSEPNDLVPRRDTITLQPGDRYDLEFVADNPGVWSLSSLLVDQSTNDGKFPGGLACVVRYSDASR